ncbi:hypothetical protein E2C01_090001 [Portunus trituberculatus]|uniref:Uncharacterized protein n=1 Tax=Portunus trituberculatus TaxID=210409 RepID=A0A5B7JJR4_PORTR|nr:hypothetical protein [Portunus trituberculatus]
MKREVSLPSTAMQRALLTTKTIPSLMTLTPVTQLGTPRTTSHPAVTATSLPFPVLGSLYLVSLSVVIDLLSSVEGQVFS